MSKIVIHNYHTKDGSINHEVTVEFFKNGRWVPASSGSQTEMDRVLRQAEKAGMKARIVRS